MSVPIDPSDNVEARVLSVFREVLGRPEITSHDDYFELGGDSLNALRIVGRIRRDLGVRVRISDLATRPTVAAFADVVGRLMAESATSDSGPS